MKLDQYKLWTALVTPLNEDLSIDFLSLKKLISKQVEAQNGLIILGSTGEGLNIHLKQRKKMIEYVLGLNLDIPIMVGVGGCDLVETMAWVQYLNPFVIHAYLMVTPIYAKPGIHGQYQWFKKLMDISHKPVMLYNVPGRTGVSLSFETVSMLKNHKNYWSIKESSGSLNDFKAYLNASSNQPVYCGEDRLMPDFAIHGASGLVSVASNVWPQETQLYVKKCLNNTFHAKALWEAVANSLFSTSNPIPVKAILEKKKTITYKTVMPPLAAQDLQDLSQLEIVDQKIKKWYHQTYNK